MRILSTLLAAAALVGAGGQAIAATPRPTAEARLAKALEGRTPGKAERCIYLRDIRSSRIFDRTAILYEMNNGKYYVNRPESGAPSLHSNDVMVINTHSPQLCNIDIIRMFDSSARMPSGVVGLGDFIPYQRIDKRR